MMKFQLDSDVLYKYCDLRGIDILQSLRLKVTPPNQFNDPFEFMPRVETEISAAVVRRRMESKKLLKSVWKELPFEIDFETLSQNYLAELNRRGSPHIKQVIKALRQWALKHRDGILAFVSKSFGFACLSEVSDDILMWSHYTANHHGFVVGFNVKNRFFTVGQNLMPMVYRSERVDATLSFSGLSFQEPAAALFRSKSPHWSYEREWRQFFMLRKCIKHRTETGAVHYFQPIPPKAIAKVILGIRCDEGTEQTVRELLRKKELKHVRLERAAIHERDFRLGSVKA
jgi:hypothetical protein